MTRAAEGLLVLLPLLLFTCAPNIIAWPWPCVGVGRDAFDEFCCAWAWADGVLALRLIVVETDETAPTVPPATDVGVWPPVPCELEF